MAFCTKCGTKTEDGVKFCPSCGGSIDEAPNQNAQTDFTAKFSQINNTADETAQYDANDIETNKMMCLFSYLSWLVLIPIFAVKNSRFTRFHINQGIVLSIAETIWWVIQAIIGNILWSALWLNSFGIYVLITSLLNLVNVAFLVLAIIGIVNAVNGKAKELPIIGKIRILK